MQHQAMVYWYVIEPWWTPKPTHLALSCLLPHFLSKANNSLLSQTKWANYGLHGPCKTGLDTRISTSFPNEFAGNSQTMLCPVHISPVQLIHISPWCVWSQGGLDHLNAAHTECCVLQWGIQWVDPFQTDDFGPPQNKLKEALHVPYNRSKLTLWSTVDNGESCTDGMHNKTHTCLIKTGMIICSPHRGLAREWLKGLERNVFSCWVLDLLSLPPAPLSAKWVRFPHS